MQNIVAAGDSVAPTFVIPQISFMKCDLALRIDTGCREHGADFACSVEAAQRCANLMPRGERRDDAMAAKKP
ncbi:hypothetical protein HNR29_006421 [Rhizobium leguminosarum]|nr:hypothetical protein [Rhizobium leguminosarum]